MKDKTIDYVLRATWQAVSRIYNEEASKFDGSMAIGFALLSIDKEDGTPSTYISNRMGMEATSLTRTPVSYTHLDVYKRQELTNITLLEVAIGNN